jgi:hypothetical protein
MEEFNQFIGKKYRDVNDQIDALAKSMGLQPVPWPVGIGMVATDDTTLVVSIQDDLNDVIVKIYVDE